MKKINILLILAVLILPGSILNAQKEDNLWLLGRGWGNEIPRRPFGGVDLTFYDNGVDTSWVPRKTVFTWTNISICSPKGELLFYSDGDKVFNRKYWEMNNGGGLGEEDYPLGNALDQGFLALPFPGHPEQNMIIHSNHEWRLVEEGWTPIVYNLKYTKIDMNLDYGLGEVIEKNVVIRDKEHSFNGLTACQHANGRDWWVIIPGYEDGESVIETYLLDPSGIKYVSTQYFPGGYFTNIRITAHTVFSPDGQYFIFAQGRSLYEPRYLHIFNFDRCRGIFSFLETIKESEHGFSHKAIVSPNSRWLYNIQDSSIFQYDLYADTIANSKVRVAKYDGFVDQDSTHFAYPALGPDGRIYINTNARSHYLHVIEKPDTGGVGCDVRQHSFQLPARNDWAMPNFPHFRLGKLEGSPCDTLITSTRDQWAASRFKVFPNPTSGPVTIELDLPEWSRDDISISLYDVTGKAVYRHRLSQWSYVHTIDPGILPAGVYLVRLEIDRAVVHTERVVVD